MDDYLTLAFIDHSFSGIYLVNDIPFYQFLYLRKVKPDVFLHATFQYS